MNHVQTLLASLQVNKVGSHTKQNIGSEFVSFQTKQLNVEDEGGVRRNDAWVAFVSISVVR